MANNDAVELLRLRNNFYVDSYRRLIIVLLLLIVTILGLVGVIFWQVYHRPKPQYFATSTDGRIMQLFPLSDPMLSPSELLQWAHGVATDAYSYNFVNYREALQQLQNNFTAEGWRYFEQSLKASRNLEMVLAKKLIVSGTATGTPVILEQAVIDGRYSWKVQIPMLVSYQSATENTQKPMIIMMIISRVPTVDMPKGIAVRSFVASEGRIGNKR